MKSFLKSMILTAVILLLGTSTWAQSSGKPAESSCESFKKVVTNLEKELERLGKVSGASTRDANYDATNNKLTQANKDYNECISDKRKDCSDLSARRKEILDKFPVSAQQAAINCLYAEDTQEDGNIMKSVMFTFSGQTPPGKKGCPIGGTKSNQKTDIEKYDKDIESLEKDINDANKDLVKLTKDSTENLSDLQEARIKLQEQWERSQEEAEDARDKALRQMQDNQIKITDEIRKAQTSLLQARQAANKIDVELKKALSKENVNTEGGMLRTCNAKLRAYVADLKKTTSSKKAGSLATAAARGGAKVKDRQDMFDECMKDRRELRAEIFQNATDNAVQAAKFISDLEQQIAQLEEQLNKQVTDYNNALQKLETRLTKAQQKYYQDDQLIAQKILQAQQNVALEQAQINEAKTKAQQKMAGLENSKATLSIEAAEEALSNSKDLADLEAQGAGCAGFSSVKSPYKNEKNKEKIEDIESRGVQ